MRRLCRFTLRSSARRRPWRHASLALWATALAGACGGDALVAPVALAVAEARWSESAPDAYQYTIRHSCFCGEELVRPVVVEVVSRSVVGARFADTGDPVPAHLLSAFTTIEGLFTVIRQAMRDDPGALRVAYDHELAFPREIHIAGDPLIADSGISYFVLDLGILERLM